MTKQYTICGNSSAEYIIQKSKFISVAFKMENTKQVDEILADLKNKYYDATHICYAYDLMQNAQKCFDDGEPSGTAGKPILDCITKQNLKNVFVAVVRYFGGIKLGAGGLVRAYTKSASMAIEKAGKREIVDAVKLCFKLNIALFNKLDNFLRQFKVLDKNVEFGESVKVTVVIEKGSQQEFCSKLQNLIGQNIIFESIVDEKI